LEEALKQLQPGGASQQFVNIGGQQIPIRLTGDSGAGGSFAVGLNPSTGTWDPLMVRGRNWNQPEIDAYGFEIPRSQMNAQQTFDWGAPETWGQMDWAFGTPKLADG